jgi:hypothetical protein
MRRPINLLDSPTKAGGAMDKGMALRDSSGRRGTRTHECSNSSPKSLINTDNGSAGSESQTRHVIWRYFHGGSIKGKHCAKDDFIERVLRRILQYNDNHSSHIPSIHDVSGLYIDNPLSSDQRDIAH